MGESVKVAVRVRPFNQREKDRGAKIIIKMEGQMTEIKNPEAGANEEPKRFSFDYSYWSHSGFVERADGILESEPGSNYASQRNVYDNLGQGVLDNAFQGYNCSLFAYGQTGSGKSYSMVGYGPNKGIVPITCDELFKTMNTNTDANKLKQDKVDWKVDIFNQHLRFEVSFSMLEIYNEQVRDLLSKDNPKGGLMVRQNPKLGLFYVEKLKKVPVGSYADIEKRMEQGTASRTVASTNMNATSSRAHTVVTITFDQIIKDPSGDKRKSSVMNLVDLAGSERADSTGATGDRLKEGANINKSLSALGNVISALADLSTGKKKVMVPYRDSVLTKLLQNALGGNSKTVMIAALSPADINYDETLGTLRYADRAKKIKNKAVINENPMDKLVRELKEENEKLRKMLSGEAMPEQAAGMSQEEMNKMRAEMMEQLKAQLMANDELMQQQLGGEQSWENQLRQAQAEEVSGGGDKQSRTKGPHLKNLNQDPMLSGMLVHALHDGDTRIGRSNSNPEPDIGLSGLNIKADHALISITKGEAEIRPGDTAGSKTKVNGLPLTGPRPLVHKDRILFGSNHLYVFFNPLKPQAPEDLPKEITYEYCQKEIAEAKGFSTGMGAGLTKDQQIAQEQVLELLPLMSEVNAISEELDKKRSFEVILLSSAAQEGVFGSQKGTQVMVKLKNLVNGNSWLWDRGKFMNRRYMMQDMYQKWLDGDEDVSKIPKEQDPFWEAPEDVLIGTANVFLQSLAYALDFDDKLTVTDYKGSEEGSMIVNVTPCHQNGKALDEDYFVEDPNELLGKPYHFKVTIRNAEIKKARFSKGTQIKFKVYKADKFQETKMVKGSLSPEFNFSYIHSFPEINKEHLEFFDSGCITFLLYGHQEDLAPDKRLSKMTTKELREMEHIQKPSMDRRNTVFSSEAMSDQSQLKSDHMLLMRKYERLEQKEKRLQELCREWKNKPEEEKQFEPFFRAISAVASSTGTRLKTRVQMLNRVFYGAKLVRDQLSSNNSKNRTNDDDTISLCVFGEEEEDYMREAKLNGGVISFDKMTAHYGKKQANLLAAQKRANNGTSDQPALVKGSDGNKREGTRACTIM